MAIGLESHVIRMGDEVRNTSTTAAAAAATTATGKSRRWQCLLWHDFLQGPCARSRAGLGAPESQVLQEGTELGQLLQGGRSHQVAAREVEGLR